MINKEFELARDRFDSKWPQYSGDNQKAEKERVLFVKTFPLEKILLMEIDDYVIGKGSKESFCYWLENRLKDLGDMHGATSFKFGVYFGRTKSDNEKKYRYRNKFGDNYVEAFENIKKEISKLLEAGKSDNYPAIRENLISPMFKGKILSTYYPEKYLDIFTDEHLNHYLEKLQLICPDEADELEKRRILVRFKNSDPVMETWSLSKFSTFIWATIGVPSKK